MNVYKLRVYYLVCSCNSSLFFFAIVSHIVHSTFCLVAKGDRGLFIFLPPHLTNTVLEIRPLDFVGTWQVFYQSSHIPAPNYIFTTPTLKWLRSRHPKTLAILLRAASLGKPEREIIAHIQWGRKQGGEWDKLATHESAIKLAKCSNSGTFGRDRAEEGVGEDESESPKALVFDEL